MNAPLAANAAALSGLRVSLTSAANRSSFADSCAGLVDTPIRRLLVSPYPELGPRQRTDPVVAGHNRDSPVEGPADVTVVRNFGVPLVDLAGSTRQVQQMTALV